MAERKMGSICFYIIPPWVNIEANHTFQRTSNLIIK